MNIKIKRWMNNWRNIIRDFLSALGLFWLILGIINYFFVDFSNLLKKIPVFLIILITSFLYGIFKNCPKMSCIKKIRGKDVHIEIQIGDAFKNNGALIIPINNEFDVSLSGNVKKAKSIQNQLITNFYDSKEEHLKNDISKKIDLAKIPYPAGTTIEIEHKDKRFYLVVNSKKKENDRVNSSIDDFMMALNGIWDYLSNDAGKDESITIPLLNTQHGRDSNINRDAVVKQIIETFINSTRHRIVCDKLVISIYPNDLEKGQMDFDKLVNYLAFQCENYKEIKFDLKPEGKEIEASNISKIEN